MEERIRSRPCACTGYAWRDSARACYELRSYGIAGLGAPSLDEDDGECECACHDELDSSEDDW